MGGGASGVSRFVRPLHTSSGTTVMASVSQISTKELQLQIDHKDLSRCEQEQLILQVSQAMADFLPPRSLYQWPFEACSIDLCNPAPQFLPDDRTNESSNR